MNKLKIFFSKYSPIMIEIETIAKSCCCCNTKSARFLFVFYILIAFNSKSQSFDVCIEQKQKQNSKNNGHESNHGKKSWLSTFCFSSVQYLFYNRKSSFLKKFKLEMKYFKTKPKHRTKNSLSIINLIRF